MQSRLFTPTILLIVALILPAAVFGDSAADAANRIKQRLAQVDDMKAAGEIGENAEGYIVERQSLAGRKASIVSSENADRKIIYESVAARTGQSISEVAEQRALQIAQRARSGVWLQKPSGEWYQKP